MRSIGSMLLVSVLIGAWMGDARGAINFDPAVPYATGHHPEGGVLFDFTNDGFLDLAVTTDDPNQIQFFANEGDGTFGTPFSLETGNATGPEGLAAGDFNNDNHVDLVVALFSTNQVQIILGDGAGHFALGATADVGIEPSVVVAADFDDDGFLDAAVNNRVSGTVSVLLNNGAAGFDDAVSYAVGEETRCVAAGDLTGDGLPDLAVSARDSRRVRLFKNVGGAFQILQDLSLGAILEPQGVGMADLDGDHALDVFTATSGNALQEHASVFLQNNGSSHWVGPINGATGGTSPRGIVSADFDLDGFIDVATANADSNNLSVLKNGGIGIFFLPVLFPIGQNPEALVLLTGDLDHNGGSDLVALNRDSDDVSVLLNRNSAAVDVDEMAGGLVSALRLDPAAPNPARGASSISFFLPQREEVALRLIDASGRVVRSLAAGVMAAGVHRAEWDGRDDLGNRVASGTYWIELAAGGAQTSQRLVYLR